MGAAVLISANFILCLTPTEITKIFIQITGLTILKFQMNQGITQTHTYSEQLDYISVGLPSATEVGNRQMSIQDGITHSEDRFPKEAIAF